MKTIGLYVVVGFSGIIFVTADGQGDAGCDNRTFLSTCCSNDFENIHNGTVNKICSACIGRSCRPQCPQGYYEEQCDGICTCDADVCDDVSGCRTTDEQQEKPLGMVLKISLSASLFIIIVLLVILLNVVYRARKNNTGYPIVSTERNASNVSSDYITRDSPVIYAAVVRPNRKPARGVEQSDRMYGNTLKLQKPNRERKKKPKTSKIHTSSNATNEEGLKNGTPATYSFVEHPNTTLLLDVGNPYRTSSLDKGHPDRALSLDVRHHDRTIRSMET